MTWWRAIGKALSQAGNAEAIDTLARTAWGEARGQGMDGLAAVCNVVGNRVRKGGWWGNTYISVCKKPWQFSCWNEGDPNRAKVMRVQPGNIDFDDALVLARAQVEGRLHDRTMGATHYYAKFLDNNDAAPTWAFGKQPITVIGDHKFYRGIA